MQRANCFIMQTLAHWIRALSESQRKRRQKGSQAEMSQDEMSVLCNDVMSRPLPPLSLMARGHLLYLLHTTLTLSTSFPLSHPLISGMSHQGGRDWHPPSPITDT